MENKNPLMEAERCREHIERTRVLVRAAWSAWEDESAEIYDCVSRHGSLEAQQALNDVLNSLLWLHREIMDFPLIEPDADDMEDIE